MSVWHFTNVLELTLQDHAEAHGHVLEHGCLIFNPNQKRLQSHIPSGHHLVKRTAAWLVEHGFMYGRTCGNAVFLHSMPGCKQQQWHTDFDPVVVTRARKKPLGVVVALEDDTFFETPSKTYHMAHGDIVIFEGDAVHAGSAYDVSNTRMHIYIDAAGCPRKNNRTYPIRKCSLAKKKRLPRS